MLEKTIEELAKSTKDLGNEQQDLKQACDLLYLQRSKVKKNVDALQEFKTNCYSFMGAGKKGANKPMTPLPPAVQRLIALTPTPEEEVEEASLRFKERS